MKRILVNALFAGAVIGPAALVLSADALGPAVSERLVLAAPAGDPLVHRAVDLVGTDEYPLQLLPADGASLLHTGRFEPDAATTLLPAVVLDSDVLHGASDCGPHLLRVAAIDTDSGRFGLVLAPAGSPAALGDDLLVAAPAAEAPKSRGDGVRTSCAAPSAI